MREKLLEVKDLYVQYNTDDAVVHALNGMSLTVDKGEVVGLVGDRSRQEHPGPQHPQAAAG